MFGNWVLSCELVYGSTLIDLFCLFVEIDDAALLAGVVCSSFYGQGRDYFLDLYLGPVAFGGSLKLGFAGEVFDAL